MSKKKILIISGAVIILAVVLFLIFKPGGKQILELETVTFTKRDISSYVTATGTIEPITVVEVGTQVSGIISNIFVDYNSEVKKGQVLAELDKITLQTELESQELEVKSNKTEYEYQKKNFERSKELYEKSLISTTDYETAKYNYDKAEAAYQKSTSNLQKSKTNLGYATIYSPIDGIVLSRAVEEGQTVAASFSTPTLFTIANDLTKMQVVANVDEADIGGVLEGQRVTFTVDAYPNDVFDGKVTQVRLEATVTSNVVTYEVIVDAPNPDLKLKPGLTANITIYTLEQNGVLSLPNKVFNFIPDPDALAEYGYDVLPDENDSLDEKEKVVWTNDGKSISPKKIRIGETDGINTEITGGLDESESVIAAMNFVSGKTAQSNNSETSPFMPQRPGSQRK